VRVCAVSGAADAVRRIAAAVPIAIASGARRERSSASSPPPPHRSLRAIVAPKTRAQQARSRAVPAGVRLLGAVVAGEPLRPAECVAIEDSHWGIESARVAGLRTIA